MATLRVRVYGVRFGDAILVTVPDRHGRQDTERHLLIDVGNAPSGVPGGGGADTVFRPVVENILEVLDGKPLDLYVMTHTHMDHVQGLLHAAQKSGLDVRASYAWLTASAAEDYYDTHPEAKKKKLQAERVCRLAEHFSLTAPEHGGAAIAMMAANNSPQSTDCCVDHLRRLAPAEHTTYVYRGCSLAGTHPFQEVEFAIWAPEENTAEYYGRFHPMALGAADGASASAAAEAPSVPPAGVDAGAFYDLVEARRRGCLDNLLMIDQAANNTSVVFTLAWRGWKLLFAGDAERRSWLTMEREHVLQPVHFLKVSHHGSSTGTPSPELLDKILPSAPPDRRHRSAVVSTYPDAYSGVPDVDLISTEVGGRCDSLCWVSKGEVADGEYRDITFEA
jgi:hypothetical protein